MDPGAEELDYGDEYDDLYNDVNVGEKFQQMQQPVTQIAPKVNPPETYVNIPESKVGFATDKGQMVASDNSQQGRVMGINFNVQKENFVPQGLNPMPQKTSFDNSELPVKAPNQTSMIVNHSNNGSTMLFVGELHWWTTDEEIERVMSRYGRVKEIKFFDERSSGKSKGYCQVEFYDSASAASCKEGMNGHVFNGRACVVAFASPQTIRQMGSSYANKAQTRTQTQSQFQRRPMNDNVGRGGGTNNGEGGRSYGGRGGWGGRGGPAMVNQGPVNGPIRGRGGPMGGRNGPGFNGPSFGGPVGGMNMMNTQGMMGGAFDTGFMGRGGGYGGFPGHGFPGVIPSFPHMGMAGVAPHVNPAFFGRGMVNNGQVAMWNDTSMGGGEEYGQRTRESSYGGEEAGSEYGYVDGSQEKAVRSNVASKEWEIDERERERPERNHRYREENDEWDRGQSSSRPRSRSKALPEEDYRRSRDADYGKRRRLPSE